MSLSMLGVIYYDVFVLIYFSWMCKVVLGYCGKNCIMCCIELKVV